jgi:hypothetical protein
MFIIWSRCRFFLKSGYLRSEKLGHITVAKIRMEKGQEQQEFLIELLDGSKLIKTKTVPKKVCVVPQK